jgi:exonuclease VII large subunit
MSEHDAPPEEELDEFAAQLVRETDEKFEQNQEEQEEFLDTVAEEEGAEVLETKCNLIGEYTVPLKAKLDGELMDAMGRIDDRLERLNAEEARAYEISETADEVSQLLADVIEDPDWHKRKFYKAYESEGLDPLGVMLERAFTALREERERREGVADGFRPNSEGT